MIVLLSVSIIIMIIARPVILGFGVDIWVSQLSIPKKSHIYLSKKSP